MRGECIFIESCGLASVDNRTARVKMVFIQRVSAANRRHSAIILPVGVLRQARETHSVFGGAKYLRSSLMILMRLSTHHT